jgi:hypothetical protein
MASNESGTSGSSGSKKEKKGSGINDMILGSLKSRSGRETTAWISNLTNEGMQEIEDATKTQNSPTALPAQFAHPSIAQTQVKWVDKLFDLLQQYEVEFNRAINDPDLRVNADRAVITPDLIAKLQSNDQHHYKGRLHTCSWTLAIRGNLSHIEAYMIPSDRYLGYENILGDFTQLFEFVPVWDGELKWKFRYGTIGFGQLPPMAKVIFGHLIKVSKGDIDSQDPFNYGINLPPPEEKSAGPPPPAGTTLGGGKSPESDYLLGHGAVFEDDRPVKSAEFPQKDNQPERQDRAAGEAADERRSSGFDDASEDPDALPDLRGEQESTASGNASPAAVQTAMPDRIGMFAACDILLKSVEVELAGLSREGAKAFEEHDFIAVERLVKRSSKLKGMRDKIFATIEEWKKELSED